MAPVAALRACPLFKDFTHNGLQIIAEITEQRSFSKGAALFVENASADSLLILASGKVKLSATNAAGEPVAMGELGPGDCLGELSLTRGARFWQHGHISWRLARAFKPGFRPAQGVVTRWSSSSQTW
jgi:CRP-like cAMP-binding protein